MRGLSMVELLIAIALSAVLMLGLVEIFSATRSAFQASESLARIQENSRFALEFLRRDLRMTGQYGCLNEFAHVTSPSPPRFFHHLINVTDTWDSAPYTLRFDTPLQSYDYSGTAPGASYSLGATGPTAATAGSEWTPALPAELVAEILGGAAAGQAVTGSDVIVLRFMEEVPITVEGPLSQTEGDVELTTAGRALVQDFGIYGITNCKTASMFQAVPGLVGATSVASTHFGSQGGLNLLRPPVAPDPAAYWGGEEVYARGSLLYRYRMVAFYVGRGAADGAPALYRIGLRTDPGAAAEGDDFGPREELVEGVENLQVLFGLIPNAAPRVDAINQYQSPAGLLTGVTSADAQRAALARVASLRTSVLMRSPRFSATGNPASATVVVGDVIVTPPTDGNLRQVYDATVLLRNRVRY